MLAEFLETDDPRWSDFLADAPHDVYHLPAYVKLAAQAGGARPLAFLGDLGGARCLIPLLESEVEGSTDLASPYGYSSPLFLGDPTRRVALLRLFAERCARRGSLAVFLRGHPILSPLDPGVLPGWSNRQSSAALVSDGPTIGIDLRRRDEEIVADLRKDHRKGIDRLIKRGFTSVLDDWSHYPRFIELYYDTMARVGADSSYFFPPAYFAAIATALEGRVHLNTILSPDGAVAAGGLYFRQGDLLQYHLSASNPEMYALSPSKLSIRSMMSWGKATGATMLHLGGGVGTKEDALFWFKLGFSKLHLSFRTLGIIADRPAYDAVVRARGADRVEAYFPAYRAPQRPAAAAAEAPPMGA